jgi:hypothetical protein
MRIFCVLTWKNKIISSIGFHGRGIDQKLLLLENTSQDSQDHSDYREYQLGLT